MKILYLHQYFRTPDESGGIRSYHLAKAMSDAGHEVVMITSHNGSKPIRKNIEGIDIWYLPIPYQNEMGTFQRILSFIRFVISAFFTAVKIKEVTVCFATSTPLTIGLISLLLKKLKGIPYIFEVRDLWPEAPIQMQVIRNPLLKKILYGFERKIYLHAREIIALSPGIEAAIREKVPGKTIHIIPNMSDCTFFKPEITPNNLLKKYHLRETTFRIIYFGTLGRANHLEYLLNLATVCQDHKDDVHFLIVGSGSEKHLLEKKADHLSNTSFLPSTNKQGVRQYLSLCHAAYVSFAQLPVLETTSPNKFFDALAAGKMILVNVNGWLRQLTESNQCGFFADPENPEGAAQKLREIIGNSEQIQEYQHRSRELAEKEFERGKLGKKVVEVLEKTISPT
ncbi:MAG: glycosyltransferase family 4 protein [Bacteroidia bacterium]|nr:glycosyltransferase family 4 protein [Bacteroidia bacterium]